MNHYYFKFQDGNEGVRKWKLNGQDKNIELSIYFGNWKKDGKDSHISQLKKKLQDIENWKTVTPSKEMDFIITVRNKAVLIGEVKWGKYDGNDVKKFAEKTTFIKAEKIFITKNKNETKIDNVKIMDVDDILAMVK